MADQKNSLSEIQKDNKRFDQMLSYRLPLDPWAREIADYLMPRRPRWMIQNSQSSNNTASYGNYFNENIFDSTATLALRTAQAGFLEGATSPATPWVALGVSKDNLSKIFDVKQYLDITNKVLLNVYDQGNFYFEMSNHFLDLLCLPASVTLLEEDPKFTIRLNTLSWGTYVMDVDENGDVNTIGREEEYEVRQLVPKFCKMLKDGKYNLSNLTEETRGFWEAGDNLNLDRRIMVRHMLMPNPNFNAKKPQSKFNKWVSRYFEKTNQNSASNNKSIYLRESGFNFFPAIVSRWNKRSQEIYANDCPGLMVLGDIKQLYKNTEDQNHHIDLVLDPPLTGPEAFAHDIIDKGPGGFTAYQGTDPDVGLKPLYQITADIKWVNDKIKALQSIINRGFYVDMFQTMSALRERVTTQITAAEVNAIRSEKLVELGPVIQSVFRSLRHCIDVTYILLNEQGRLPPPPDVLVGEDLPPEFISPFARAQKMSVLALYDKLLFVVGQMAGLPGCEQVTMEVNFRAILDQITRTLNLPADFLFKPEVVQQIKQQLAQSQQAQQQAETIKSGAQAAQHLAGAPTDQDNLLTRLLGMAQAGGVPSGSLAEAG